MCLICQNYDDLSIPHLISEINSLSNEEFDNILLSLKKQHKNSSFLNENASSILRKTILAMLAVKSRKTGLAASKNIAM